MIVYEFMGVLRARTRGNIYHRRDSMTDALVPFGKYKNQPTAVLAADPAYCDWLIQQGWLAEKYPGIHTLVINHFGEPTDTPAHNRRG